MALNKFLYFIFGYDERRRKGKSFFFPDKKFIALYKTIPYTFEIDFTIHIHIIMQVLVLIYLYMIQREITLLRGSQIIIIRYIWMSVVHVDIRLSVLCKNN